MQTAFDFTQILVGLPDDSKRGPLAAVVTVEMTDRDIELPDPRLLRDQGGGAASTVRVEVQNQYRAGPCCQGLSCRKRQAVEGAKTFTALAPCMVKPARERSGHTRPEGLECRGHGSTI
jgi:hypothetical protein